jgi:hypothetical protein
MQKPAAHLPRGAVDHVAELENEVGRLMSGVLGERGDDRVEQDKRDDGGLSIAPGTGPSSVWMVVDTTARTSTMRSSASNAAASFSS